MCKACGLLWRKDNLVKKHFPFCQPTLAGDESGFLKFRQEPERNHEEVLIMLRMIGCDSLTFKSAECADNNLDETETEKDSQSQQAKATEPE